MQVIHYLPIAEQLALPPNVASRVIKLLIEPFGSLKDATDYWQEYPSIVVCLNSHDKVAAALHSLDVFIQHYIECADSTPELVELLPDEFQLSLTIINDGNGNGLYLIKPTDMNLTEVSTDG